MKNITCFKYLLLVALVACVIAFSLRRKKTAEPFVPFLNQMYRPYARSLRVFTENSSTVFGKSTHLYLKKAGLI